MTDDDRDDNIEEAHKIIDECDLALTVGIKNGTPDNEIPEDGHLARRTGTADLGDLSPLEVFCTRVAIADELYESAEFLKPSDGDLERVLAEMEIIDQDDVSIADVVEFQVGVARAEESDESDDDPDDFTEIEFDDS